MPILKAKNRAGRDIPNAVTVIHGTDLPKVNAVYYNTEGQLTLGKMASSAVKNSTNPWRRATFAAPPRSEVASLP